MIKFSVTVVVPNYSILICYLQVLLDKLALEKEKHTLLQENQQLRAVLKQYLDGMFVSNPSFCFFLSFSICLSFLGFNFTDVIDPLSFDDWPLFFSVQFLLIVLFATTVISVKSMLIELWNLML